jgi:chaperonin GroES
MTNTSGLQPVDQKVLVLPDPAEEKTSFGLIIPESVRDKNKYATMECTLIAVGANAFIEWGKGNGLAPGDRILMAQYAGARTKGADGQEYILMNDEDIIASRKDANG